MNKSYEDAKADEWVERLERPGREVYAERERLVADLGIQAGTAVADVGAGTGAYVGVLSKAVGPTGKVFAVDITSTFLEHIDALAKENDWPNVRTVLCKPDSVELAAESVDLVFTCDTYHHFEYPLSSTRSIHRALRPGGRFVVVDFIREEGKSREWILGHVRADQETVRAEVESCGFVREKNTPTTDYLKENYVMVFRKVD